MKKLLSLMLMFVLCFSLIAPSQVSAAVNISKAKATLEVDSTLQLKVKGTSVKPTWKTSKKAVATVSSTGIVTAKSVGSATITATVSSIKYTCTVTIVDSNKAAVAKTYSLGDTWVIDGQWSLTFNAVTSTDDRNPYSDKKPDQVIILDYSYENLGYTSSYMDLFISDGDMKIIDEKGEIASSYPGDVTTYPQEIPVGAKCSNAQVVIGLNNESDTLTIYVEQYDSKSVKQKATFKLKID